MSRLAAAAVLAISAAGCATPTAPPESGGLMRQTLEVAPGLERVAVRVDIPADAPHRVRVSRPDAVAVARALPSGNALAFDADGVLALPRAASGLTYEVAIPRLPWSAAQRDAHALLVDPAALLCRPADGATPSMRVAVIAPRDVTVSTPWRRDGDAWLVPPSTFRNHGRIAIGRFAPVICHSGGTEIECVVTAPLRASAEDVARCMTAAADAALPLAGAARPERILAILRPAHGQDEPVLFGETLYGGGATLQLLVGAEADGRALLGEWVVPHEMVHLAMPRVSREDAWFSEGIATYYQNVLRARAGMLDEQDAWDAFTAGVARGQRATLAGHTLESDSRYMRERHAFMRVYWSGAAIAFLWDLELRREHDRTLDDALRHAAQAFPPGRRPVSATRLLAHMDEWLGDPLFSRVAERWLASREFPGIEAALRRLGADGPFLDDAAPESGLRRGIMGSSSP